MAARLCAVDEPMNAGDHLWRKQEKWKTVIMCLLGVRWSAVGIVLCVSGRSWLTARTGQGYGCRGGTHQRSVQLQRSHVSCVAMSTSLCMYLQNYMLQYIFILVWDGGRSHSEEETDCCRQESFTLLWVERFTLKRVLVRLCSGLNEKKRFTVCNLPHYSL